MAAVAVVLLFIALSPRSAGTPAVPWLVAGVGPLVVLAVAQALPLGWHHPWITPDLATLAAQGPAPVANQWSIDPGRSIDTATWVAALAALAWCLMALFPIRRLPLLADGVVLALAGFAGWALAISLMSGASGPRSWAVGTFVYHNHAGAAWAACLPLALVQAHARGGWRWIVPALLAVAAVHSASRGAIIVGLLVSAPLLIAQLPTQRRWLAVAAVTAGLALFFALIGTGAASQRFQELGENQAAETLNGRVVIWRAAAPVIADAQPFGSGAGTAGLAMQRAVGIDATGDIDHLHSEPLELLLEFGWLGALMIASGVVLGAFLVWRNRERTAPIMDGSKRLALGAGLGVLILGLHSLTDYILHNPAIDLLAVALLTICIQGCTPPRWYPAGSWRRGAVAISGFALLAMTAIAMLREHELQAVPRTGMGATVAARTSEFASAMAETLRTAPEQARPWLDRAAELAPGSAAAWRVRTLLESDAHHPDAALAAASRMLAWAPDRDSHQDTALFCLEHLPTGLARDPRASALTRTLLSGDRTWPLPAWETFARILGADGLAAIITTHPHEPVRAAALPWLRQHGELTTWQTVRSSVKPRLPLDPIQWCLAIDDRDPRSFSIAIARDRDGRRAQADRCLRAGLTLPPALDAALADDGESGAIQRQLAQSLDQPGQLSLRGRLDRLLHMPWARPWWTLLHEREEAALGHWSALNVQSEPPLLAQGADAATRNGDAAMAARLSAMLFTYHQPSWVDAGYGVRWSWLLSDPSASATIDCPGWTGILIDGRWRGWLRGTLDVAGLAGPGIHRIVLADPP